MVINPNLYGPFSGTTLIHRYGSICINYTCSLVGVGGSPKSRTNIWSSVLAHFVLRSLFDI